MLCARRMQSAHSKQANELKYKNAPDAMAWKLKKLSGTEKAQQ